MVNLIEHVSGLSRRCKRLMHCVWQIQQNTKAQVGSNIQDEEMLVALFRTYKMETNNVLKNT